MMRFLSFACVVLLAQSASASSWNAVEGVEVRHQGNLTEYTIATSEAPIFRAFAKEHPNRVILDVVGTTVSGRRIDAKGMVKDARLAKASFKDTGIARLALEVDGAVRYDVRADGKTITLSIVRDEKRKAGPPRLAQAEGDDFEGEGVGGISTGGAAMTYIGFRNLATQSKVYARMNSRAKFELKREGSNVYVLEIENASIPLRNNRNHLDATFFDSPVRMITPTEVDGDPPKIRIIIEVRDNAPFSKAREGDDLVIIFQK